MINLQFTINDKLSKLNLSLFDLFSIISRCTKKYLSFIAGNYLTKASKKVTIIYTADENCSSPKKLKQTDKKYSLQKAAFYWSDSSSFGNFRTYPKKMGK